jgi:uracil-DNA glycosylase family 4
MTAVAEAPTKTNPIDKFFPAYLNLHQDPAEIAKQCDALRARIFATPVRACDIETGGALDDQRKKAALDPRSARIVGLSVCWKESAYTPLPIHQTPPINQNGDQYPSIYIPLRHALIPQPPQCVFDLVRDIINDPNSLKIFHGAVFDIPMLKWRDGIDTPMPWLDTMIQSWVYDENQAKALKDLANLFIGWEPLSYGDIAKNDFGTLPPEVAYRYACQDAYITFLLALFFNANLYEDGKKLIAQLEMPIQEIFLNMCYEGIPVDLHYVRRLTNVCDAVIEKIEEKIHTILGKINIGSPAQLKKALNENGVKVPNTQEDTLKQAAAEAVLKVRNAPTDEDRSNAERAARAANTAQMVVAHRTFSKVRKTYLGGLEKEIWTDGRIHPKFIQWYFNEATKRGGGARTGRSSAQSPNVQNFPRAPIKIPEWLVAELPQSILEMCDQDNGTYTINIRNCWATTGEDVFVAGDGSQIEMRMAAAVTGEPMLLELYKQPGVNVYKKIGEEANRTGGRGNHEIVKGSDEYDSYKKIVLGLGYGSGPATIQEQLRDIDIIVDLPIIEEMHRNVSATLPTITQYYPAEVRAQLASVGYVETVFKRRRRFPKFHPRDNAAVRQAVNMAMGQSPAFDVMKNAMKYVAAQLKALGLRARMCGQIHDEIIILAPRSEAATCANVLYDALTRPEWMEPFPYKVPLDAEVKWGTRYGSLVEWKFASGASGASGAPENNQTNEVCTVQVCTPSTEQNGGAMKTTSSVHPSRQNLVNVMISEGVSMPEMARRMQLRGPEIIRDWITGVAMPAESFRRQIAEILKRPVESLFPDASVVEMTTAPPESPSTSPPPQSPKERYMAILRDAIPCTKCDHFMPYGHKKVGIQGALSNVIIAYVGANAGVEEMAAGVPSVGRSGSLLRQQLYMMGLPCPPDQERATIINALYCGSETTEGITGVHIKNCRPFLDRMLDIVRPKIIVALGSIAIRAVLRIAETAVDPQLGWHALPDGCRAYCTFHPAFLLRSPGYTVDFQNHLREVKTYYDAIVASEA